MKIDDIVIKVLDEMPPTDIFKNDPTVDRTQWLRDRIKSMSEEEKKRYAKKYNPKRGKDAWDISRMQWLEQQAPLGDLKKAEQSINKKKKYGSTLGVNVYDQLFDKYRDWDKWNKTGIPPWRKSMGINDDWDKWSKTGIPPWENKAFKDRMEAKQLRKAMEAGGQGINVHKDSWNASLQAKAMKEAQMAAMANEANRIAKKRGANPPKGNPDYYKAMLLNDAQKDLFDKMQPDVKNLQSKLRTPKPGFNWRMLKNPWLAAAAGLGAAGTYFWPEDKEPYGKAGAYGDDTMSQRRLAYRGPLAPY